MNEKEVIQKGDSVLINMQLSGVEDPGEDWVVCAWVAMVKACLTAYGREFVFRALVSSTTLLTKSIHSSWLSSAWVSAF